MGAPDSAEKPSQPSALQKLLDAHPRPADSPHSTDLHNLSLQIAHNLRFQHSWTDVRLHTRLADKSEPLPRPLLSGVPPRRLYVHPDEQISLLQKQKDQGKTGMPDLRPQREWVLPSHLREKWTLRRFGETFDAIDVVPSEEEGEGESLFPSLYSQDSASEEVESKAEDDSEWRQKSPKRLLLATLEDGSTIVYYIIHDGIVKPRQN